MKTINCIAIGMLCLPSIWAAEEPANKSVNKTKVIAPNDQGGGDDPTAAKGKTVRIRVASTNNQGKSTGGDTGHNKLSSGHTAKKGAPQGKLYVGTDHGVYQSDGTNNKKNLTSGHKFTTQAGGPEAPPTNGHHTGALENVSGTNTWNKGGKNKKNLSSGNKPKARSSTNYQGQHSLYQDTFTPSQSGKAHTGSSGRIGSVAVDPSDPSGQTGGKKIKRKKSQTNETRKDKNMTLKGQKVLQN